MSRACHEHGVARPPGSGRRTPIAARRPHPGRGRGHVGKTTTLEYGWKGESGNRVNGPAHNPWRHGLTPGARRRVGRGGRRRGGRDGAGRRRRRLDPDPALVLRRFGPKPTVGLVPTVPGLGPLGPGPDRPHGGRRRAPARLMAGTSHSRSLEEGVEGVRAAWSADLGYAAVEAGVLEVAAAARRLPELGLGSRTPTRASTTRGPSSTRSGPGTRPRARIPTSATSPTRAAGRWSSAAFGMTEARPAAAHEARGATRRRWTRSSSATICSSRRRCRARRSGRRRPARVGGRAADRVPELDGVHLPVQRDGPARGVGAVRARLGRAPGRPPDRGPAR